MTTGSSKTSVCYRQQKTSHLENFVEVNLSLDTRTNSRYTRSFVNVHSPILLSLSKKSSLTEVTKIYINRGDSQTQKN